MTDASSAQFLIFDFETLSSKPSDAPIISLGAIAGRWENMDTVETLRHTGFYRNVDAIQQVKEYGLKVSLDTLKWWASQGAEAKKVLNATDKISLKDTIIQFNDWCSKMGVTHDTIVWTRGPNFDLVIYENLIEKVGMSTYRPFSHWKSRDLRTIYNSTTGYPPNYKQLVNDLNLTKHNALDDVILEYCMIKEWYQ